MALLTTKDRAWLAANQPGLVLFYRPGCSVLEGNFSFHRTFNDVPIQDIYEIRLELPYDSTALPRLTETASRLKSVLASRPELNGKQVNMHAYLDWTLCLAAPQELRLQYLPNSSVQLLFERYIEPYFYSQSFFEQNRVWPWLHLPHGIDGILEWFRDNCTTPGALKETAIEIRKLAKNEEFRAARMVARAMRPEGFAPRSKCLCGGKNIYLQCHRSYIKLALALRA